MIFIAHNPFQALDKHEVVLFAQEHSILLDELFSAAFKRYSEKYNDFSCPIKYIKFK